MQFMIPSIANPAPSWDPTLCRLGEQAGVPDAPIEVREDLLQSMVNLTNKFENLNDRLDQYSNFTQLYVEKIKQNQWGILDYVLNAKLGGLVLAGTLLFLVYKVIMKSYTRKQNANQTHHTIPNTQQDQAPDEDEQQEQILEDDKDLDEGKEDPREGIPSTKTTVYSQKFQPDQNYSRTDFYIRIRHNYEVSTRYDLRNLYKFKP